MLHEYIKKRIHAKWTISSENNPLLPAAEAVEDLVFSFNSCLITIFPEKEEVVLKQLILTYYSILYGESFSKLPNNTPITYPWKVRFLGKETEILFSVPVTDFFILAEFSPQQLLEYRRSQWHNRARRSIGKSLCIL